MATRNLKSKAKAAVKKVSGKRAERKEASQAARKEAPLPPMFDPKQLAAMDFSKVAKMMTPEQAMELYKANAKMALDVINAAIENTSKLRRLQFEGEEESRAMGRKAAKRAAEAGTPDEMMAAGQTASQEAMEHAMRYWGQMFDMISEMQKRLWVMMEEQMAGVPGVKEAKAAMSMMPDLRGAQNVIKAMQGVVGAGGNAFESMQKVMGDFTKMMPGMKK
ncbi:MAG: phasin family protein [Casimicrobiaceae bacterium]